MPVYAKQPIIPCAGRACLLRRAVWVSWCSSPGVLLYIPAMFKAELVKRKTALKESVVKPLALWWDAWAEQSDPHSCSYRRICLLVVVVLLLLQPDSVWCWGTCSQAGPTALPRGQDRRRKEDAWNPSASLSLKGWPCILDGLQRDSSVVDRLLLPVEHWCWTQPQLCGMCTK